MRCAAAVLRVRGVSLPPSNHVPGPPRREEDAAPAVEAGPSLGPSWRPADGDYEELPEAPSDEDGGEGGEHALGDDDAADDAGVADAPTRYVSVPPSLAHAPPLPPPPAEPCRAELQVRVALRVGASAQP